MEVFSKVVYYPHWVDTPEGRVQKPRKRTVYRTQEGRGRPPGTGWTPTQDMIKSIEQLRASGLAIKNVAAHLDLQVWQVCKVIKLLKE